MNAITNDYVEMVHGKIQYSNIPENSVILAADMTTYAMFEIYYITPENPLGRKKFVFYSSFNQITDLKVKLVQAFIKEQLFLFEVIE
jgi:hypothetical protein